VSTLGTARVLHGNALDLPLEDGTVDLVVTSPPYFGLRSYQDGGEHYAGQIGAEATPAEFVDALIAATAEMVRVLKPGGSIFVNLGDKYVADNRGSGTDVMRGPAKWAPAGPAGFISGGMRQKSLMGIPWRYALRCIDDLGLILRRDLIWSKPNGLPESVTDRCRSSHEYWFHLVTQPRYFAAVDEIREEHVWQPTAGYRGHVASRDVLGQPSHFGSDAGALGTGNPLGKLPGSVWTIPTQPLKVPAHLGVDHFAAFPVEWPLRLILGWSPSGICTACGEGRRPVAERASAGRHNNGKHGPTGLAPDNRNGTGASTLDIVPDYRITGYACACPDTTAPTTPARILDPFGGTGTTALAAKVLGREGISVDLSRDYCRLAEWRTNDPDQIDATRERARRHGHETGLTDTDDLGLFELLEGA
jgi:DNA modification methylase